MMKVGLVVGLVAMVSAQGQTSPQMKAATAAAAAATAKGQTAEQFFKNVTSSTLKGLTPSDFLGAMGVILPDPASLDLVPIRFGIADEAASRAGAFAVPGGA